MLIMTEKGWTPFVGSSVVAACTDDFGDRVVTATVPCRTTEPLCAVSPAMHRAEEFIKVLRDFIFTSDARFLDPKWQRAKSVWNGQL